MTPRREHIMLTVLGVDPNRQIYTVDGRRAEASVATAALCHLLPAKQRPDRVLALCTDEAEGESLPLLRDGLRSLSCPVKAVRVGSDATPEAIQDFLTQLTQHVPDGTDLTIDLTHGPRHYPFLVYAGVLYLTALRDVRLRGAYYGQRGPGTFVDVRPLIELPRWFHAVMVLKETGGAHAVAELVKSSTRAEAGTVANALNELSEAHASALPLELGHRAHSFLQQHIGELEATLDHEKLPLAEQLVSDFRAAVEAQQFREAAVATNWKPQTQLDRAELQRWARIIDDRLRRRDYPVAIRLMREWMVLWAMLRQGAAADWLDYGKRERFKGMLDQLVRRYDNHEPLPDGVPTVAKAWKHIRDLRNRYAHHALDKKVALTTDSDVARQLNGIGALWRDTLRLVPDIDLPPLPRGRALVSPIGNSPGALFSALNAAAECGEVARCVVICTSQTEGAVADACRRAGFTGEVKFLRLDDPHPDGSVLDRLTKRSSGLLVDAGEVLVNLTGGTTLMGVLADRIGARAKRDGRSVFRFAVVDRRSPADQAADPYQVGEVCWLNQSPRSSS